MKKKYEDLDIGDTFFFPGRDSICYMKIDHEDDHNYWYVVIQPLNQRGRTHCPERTDFIVDAVDII